MTKLGLILLVLLIITPVASGTEILSLAQAIEMSNQYSEYRAWEDQLAATEESLLRLENQKKLQITVGGDRNGGLVSYSYDLQESTGDFRLNPEVSLTKSTWYGSSISASLSSGYNSRSHPDEWNTSWSVGAEQRIFPSPGLSSESINRNQLVNSITLAKEQQEIAMEYSRLKTTELYRAAQFATARVDHADADLEFERANNALVQERKVLGEASELEIINGQLSLLRAKRELEAARLAADTARERLFAELDLKEDYRLEQLQTGEFTPVVGNLPEAEVLVIAEANSLTLAQRLGEVSEQALQLEQALEDLKPTMALNASLVDGEVFSTLLSVSFPLADGHLRKTLVKDKEEALIKAREGYEDAKDQLGKDVEEAFRELADLAGAMEIALLTKQKARIELQIAKQQYHKGLLLQSEVTKAAISLDQAALNYAEKVFQYNMAHTRLAKGLISDALIGRAE